MSTNCLQNLSNSLIFHLFLKSRKTKLKMNGDGKLIKIVPTRAALLLKNKSEFSATVFEKPVFNFTRKVQDDSEEARKTLNRDSSIKSGSKKDELEFDIKKARHEVLNFAINGTRTKNKKKMQIVHAIKLGAKPPKKAYKNYKELLDEKKRLKQIREERQKFHQLGKNQTGAASVRCSKRKSIASANQKKKAPVSQISKNYGVVKPKLNNKKRK